ncbi:MAG: rhamnulokinase family protein [Bacilli bacterium]
MKAFVAVDLGATSGRVMLFNNDSALVELVEIHRFSNYLIKEGSYLYWDIKMILKEIKKGLRMALKKHDNIVSIGIDTFGVDFGILDKNNNLVQNPLSYRNNLGVVSKEIVNKKIDQEELYFKTGIQYMPFNTLYQLVYLNDVLKIKYDKVLLLPDLIAYYLTGNMATEKTNFSTTNLMNANTYDVIDEVEKLNIGQDVFPKFIENGNSYGYLKEEVMKELVTTKKIKVIAVCSHDTASAILSIPKKQSQVFISSGTWSLLGTCLTKPNTSKIAEKYNFSNELGYDNNVRFLKNIMGLWIINEVIKVFKKDNSKIDYHYIYEKMVEVRPFVSFIDVDDIRFMAPNNMVEEIKNYCQETNQKIPTTIGEITMTVYQSLVFKYKTNIEKLEKITQRTFNKIYLVGGGGNIEILNQMISSATNTKVIIGHTEATVIGNLIIQLKASGVIKTINEGIDLFEKGDNKIYEPNQVEDYEEAYGRYLKILAKIK